MQKTILGYEIYLSGEGSRTRIEVSKENSRERKSAWIYYDSENAAMFAWHNIKNFSGVKNFVRKTPPNQTYWNLKR